MTIGIGFKCRDGLVLATDTKYTQGDLKSHGPKLFTLFAPKQPPNLSVVVAGAGTVSFMKRAIEEIEAYLKLLADPTLNEVRSAIEQALESYYREHIHPRPSHWTPIEIDLIIGVWTNKDGYALLTSNETNVTLVTTYGTAACSVGMGRYIANYALGLIWHSGATVETAKLMAAFCIKAAKDHANSCGGSTHIVTMHQDGSGYLVHHTSSTEIKDSESDSAELYKMAGELLRHLDSKGLTRDDDIKTITDYIGEKVVEFRKKRKRREERLRKAKETLRLAEEKSDQPN